MGSVCTRARKSSDGASGDSPNSAPDGGSGAPADGSGASGAAATGAAASAASDGAVAASPAPSASVLSSSSAAAAAAAAAARLSSASLLARSGTPASPATADSGAIDASPRTAAGGRARAAREPREAVAAALSLSQMLADTQVSQPDTTVEMLRAKLAELDVNQLDVVVRSIHLMDKHAAAAADVLSWVLSAGTRDARRPEVDVLVLKGLRQLVSNPKHCSFAGHLADLTVPYLASEHADIVSSALGFLDAALEHEDTVHPDLASVTAIHVLPALRADLAEADVHRALKLLQVVVDRQSAVTDDERAALEAALSAVDARHPGLVTTTQPIRRAAMQL